ncbi:hypothetical protein NDU88_001996 [Pleurodeles waltl]|uniref:Uncharacterized protein n=1 Tax=Pleurodeles waltl TaxID=8319 RepID=A0AAV7Q8N1_PLEWA|nr:hypothetical protein NDU88_001996 [Pleurodeles waltl]
MGRQHSCEREMKQACSQSNMAAWDSLNKRTRGVLVSQMQMGTWKEGPTLEMLSKAENRLECEEEGTEKMEAVWDIREGVKETERTLEACEGRERKEVGIERTERLSEGAKCVKYKAARSTRERQTSQSRHAPTQWPEWRRRRDPVRCSPFSGPPHKCKAFDFLVGGSCLWHRHW